MGNADGLKLKHFQIASSNMELIQRALKNKKTQNSEKEGGEKEEEHKKIIIEEVFGQARQIFIIMLLYIFRI